MITRRLAILTLGLLATTAGAAHHDAGSLDTARAHGIHAHPRPAREEYLRIDADHITKTVICRDGEEMETLQVTAPARVTDRSVEILHPALDVRRAGYVDCVARLDAGVIDYHVDRDHTLTLHPHFGGWRKHYVMISAERPGLWVELRQDVAAIKTHLRRLGERTKRAIRAGADAWLERELREVEAKAEMIDRTYDGASRLSRRLKPAPRGEND